MNTLAKENLSYWSERAKGYSEYNQGELKDERKSLWKSALNRLILEHYKDKMPSEIKVLDVGTGPGFFALLLAESGFQVSAIDCTENMLLQARQNTGEFSSKINWILGDVQNMPLPSESFDILVTRNVTWNLPEPKKAYAEWLRVLKPSGALFNFDANWYHHLFDEDKKLAYEQDRKNVAENNLEDFDEVENFEQMDDIARRLPLSKIMRPAWDLQVMQEVGYRTATADTEIWKEVWSEIEIINNSASPTFLVTGIK